MANLVANPFDTQPEKPQNAGIIAGAQSQPAYTPQTPSVNKPTETTQGQLDSILAGDSPLMQRARTIAAQQMNGRGLLNSSMGVEAGVGAMIDRATPIANADANTYDVRARSNADAANQSLSQGANIGAQMQVQRGQQEFQAGESSLDRKHQADLQTGLQTSQQRFQADQATLDRTQQTSLTDRQITAQQQLQESQQRFSTIQSQLDREQQTELTKLQAQLQESMNNRSLPQTFAANTAASAMNAMEAILANPDLTPAAKSSAIGNLIVVANSQLAWGATFYNTPIPPIKGPGPTGVVPK